MKMAEEIPPQRNGAPNNRGRGRGSYKNQRSSDNEKSSPYCRLCRMNNHDTNDCRCKCRSRTWHTHHIRDCRNQQQDKANFTGRDDSENVVYSRLNTQHESQDMWYVDRGCSNHMTGDKNSFVELNENIKSNITLGEGRTQEVAGKGTIAIKAKNGSPKYIQDVLYVPGLAQNLFCVGQLTQKGHIVTFNDDKCLIFDKEKKQLIASITMAQNKIFPLRMAAEQKVALSFVIEDTTLWYHRYGHLNLNSLKVFKRRNMVIGMPTVDADKSICESCIMGKMHRLPFTKTACMAKAPL